MAFNSVRKADDLVPLRRVLASTYDKSGLADFARGIASACPGARFYSTGGTYDALREAFGGFDGTVPLGLEQGPLLAQIHRPREPRHDDGDKSRGQEGGFKFQAHDGSLQHGSEPLSGPTRVDTRMSPGCHTFVPRPA